MAFTKKIASWIKFSSLKLKRCSSKTFVESAGQRITLFCFTGASLYTPNLVEPLGKRSWEDSVLKNCEGWSNIQTTRTNYFWHYRESGGSKCFGDSTNRVHRVRYKLRTNSMPANVAQIVKKTLDSQFSNPKCKLKAKRKCTMSCCKKHCKHVAFPAHVGKRKRQEAEEA